MSVEDKINQRLEELKTKPISQIITFLASELTFEDIKNCMNLISKKPKKPKKPKELK